MCDEIIFTLTNIHVVWFCSVIELNNTLPQLNILENI